MAERGGARWRSGAVVLGLLVLAVLLGSLGVVLQVRDLVTAANVAQVVSVVLAVPSLAVGLVVWWRRSTKPPTAPTPANVIEAEDVLAGLVAEQWKTEAALRSLDDPDPIPVRWRLTRRHEVMDHSVTTLAPGTSVGSSDRIDTMIERYRALRRRRLVILGGPGTGKTTLAVQLLRHLLASRQDGEPVPVLLSVAGWDADTCPRLHDWLATRLRQDYPALRATQLGEAAPRTLAARGRILPVLDGLDELPQPARAAVIAALNRSLGDDDQLVLTSRTEEFTRAVRQAGCTLNTAAVIDPLPVTASVGANYLQRCLSPQPHQAWEQILSRLRTPDAPATALTEIVSTPLGLWLVRSVYLVPGADPTPLIDPRRFPTVTTLRSHLFDQLIPNLVRSRPPSDDPAEPFRPNQHHDPEQVRRWLGYLADHLDGIPSGQDRTGTRDFAWWHLALHTLRPRTLPRAAGITIGLLFGLGYWLGDEIVLGLAIAITSWFIIALVTGLWARRAARSWPTESPGFADLHVTGRLSLLVRVVSQNVLSVGLIVLVSGFLFVMPGWLLLRFVVGPASGSPLVRALGLTEWLMVGLASLTLWGLVGLTVGIARGLAAWVETPTPEGRASTPMTNWRADRTLNVTRTIVAGIAGMLLAFILWLLFVHATWLPDYVVFGRAAKLETWLPSFLIIGSGIGLAGGNHHAWLTYMVATHRLAWKRRLPRQLMPFLDDAHRLGLLRAVGPIYQFRHAELQDHLAEGYRTSIRMQTSSGTSERGSHEPAPLMEAT